jgi:hypothetical protein
MVWVNVRWGERKGKTDEANIEHSTLELPTLNEEDTPRAKG